MKKLLAGFSFCLVFSSAACAIEVTPVLSTPLPTLPDNQEVLMITVEYAPGESSSPHRHNAHTFVYVLEGEIGMRVEGGEEVALKAGSSFYEVPEDVHTVSKNNSGTQSAKFLVVFLKTVGAPTSVPLP